MPKKLTYEEVKEYIESQGYKLISKEYIKSDVKLEMICPNGHQCYISWDNFKYGRRCKECKYEKLSKEYKFSYDYVNNYVQSLGFELLSDKYENNQTPLKIKCDKGHEFERQFNNLKHNHECPVCKENKNKKKKSEEMIKEIQEYLNKFGYKLISTEYVNHGEKLDMICNEGHKCSISWGNFKSGRRCKVCNDIEKSKRNRKDYNEVKSYIESFGYELISKEYFNQDVLLTIKCPENHVFKMTYKMFKRGSRCPICNKSKGEKRISDYLDEKHIKYEYNKGYFDDLIGYSGRLLRPDFILPDCKIWIEYDGEFHYNKIYENDSYDIMKIHDKIKDTYAKEHDWKLIRIPYWEFDNIETILNKELKIINK